MLSFFLILHCSFCHINENSMRRIAERCRLLESLDLCQVEGLTERSLADIARFALLTSEFSDTF